MQSMPAEDIEASCNEEVSIEVGFLWKNYLWSQR